MLSLDFALSTPLTFYFRLNLLMCRIFLQMLRVENVEKCSPWGWIPRSVQRQHFSWTVFSGKTGGRNFIQIKSVMWKISRHMVKCKKAKLFLPWQPERWKSSLFTLFLLTQRNGNLLIAWHKMQNSFESYRLVYGTFSLLFSTILAWLTRQLGVKATANVVASTLRYEITQRLKAHVIKCKSSNKILLSKCARKLVCNLLSKSDMNP